MNKQNTEQLKKEIEQEVGSIVEGRLGLDDTNMAVIQEIVVNVFEVVKPHLISSDEIKREAEQITFDAIAPYWEGEEHGWLLVAIQNGKVIWEEKHLAPEVRSAFYHQTGKYAIGTVTTEQTEKAGEYFYNLTQSKEGGE